MVGMSASFRTRSPNGPESEAARHLGRGGGSGDTARGEIDHVDTALLQFAPEDGIALCWIQTG